MTRTVILVAICLFAACEGGKGGRFPDGGLGSTDGRIEPGLTPAPFGGGFCCPIDELTCNCFRNGGWIASQTDMCPSICDLAPVNTRLTTDVHGCETLSGPESCLQPPSLDAGI